MTLDLKAIRAAAEAASPGPWEAAGPSFGAPLPKCLNCVGRINEDEMFEDVCVSPFEEDDACSADMNFIAAANPATVISLLDRLEVAEAEVVEQARLIGIGAEKELSLMAKLEAAEKAKAGERCTRCVVFCQGGSGCHAGVPQLSEIEKTKLISEQLKRTK